MFKSFDNNSSIPNNYVYTSNRGTEYMYLDGSWLNCETMSTVASTHNFKMNQSALRQIAEHNEKGGLQIGQKYVIKESEYVYVGRNNFTINGNLLTENLNSRVKMLVEADDTAQFKNIKLGSTENIEIPDRFKLDGYTFVKNKGKWWGPVGNSNGYVTDKKMVSDLNADAIESIKSHNKNEPYPVGTTVEYNGETAVWNGTNFVVPGKGAFPDGFTQQFDDYFQDEYKPSQENGNSEQGQDSNQDSPANDSTQDSQPETSQGDEVPPESSSSSSTEVPNGYVYQSGKGKSYYKKNGQWYSSETKKPINSSSAKPLERAAQASIEKHNASASVKIGDTFTSKKGITYKYVGGDRFISDQGKLLPKDTARTVLDNLWKQADERKAQGQNDQSTEQNSDEQNSGEPTPPESSSTDAPPAQDNTSDAGNAGNGSESTEDANDPLKGLAQQIKSNPEARRIIVLLSRGDALSLMAADILLSGQQKEVAQILKSLNNEE